ncbi:MAG: hypothetical protein ACYC35_25250 [Pirellulales bacterium]
MLSKFPTAAVGMAIALAMGTVALAAEAGPKPASSPLPAGWLANWNAPPLADRPLQIIHGIPAARANVEGMAYYKDRGLGGVVCNVAFQDYMTSEENWKTLVAGIEACEKLGMVVWLYDEAGYPSGAAGGLVLKENRAFEAMELAYDSARPDPFVVRPAYEHTHASNNFDAAQRYVNLLDDRAIQMFIAKTHAAYWGRLEKHFGHTIEAAFTDEPSLMAVNLGQLGDDVRKSVPVIDPLDPAVASLPCVPWSGDLAAEYRKRYGEDLLPRRRSLFAGDAPEDRQVRRQYWALVADLVGQRYFGAIQDWCHGHRIASSGHCLWEEELLHHVPLEGNGLKMLGRMDIPGLDMLSSDPEVVTYVGWLTAGLPSSAAMLNGRRRVMTEISDFSQTMSKQPPATLDEMRAAAAWQAAWGVTDFTLYYGIASRSVEDYRAYGDYVGRLNAVLKPARQSPEVLLYYPIYDLWAEYRPVAEPLQVQSQSPRAQRIVGSFMKLGETLQRRQIPFAVVDHEYLAAMVARPGGKLAIKDHEFTALVLPEDVELPPAAAKTVDEFRRQGGRVVADAGRRLFAQSPVEKLQPPRRLSPASERVAMGRFLRDGREILLVANVAKAPYQGSLSGEVAGTWQIMDPATGEIHPVETDPTGGVRVSLAARQAILLVRNP